MKINHPLPNGTNIKVLQKTCACAGGRMKEVQGTILKVIQNHSGLWYYLNTGITVKAENVQQVL